MLVEVSSAAPRELACDALVVPVFADEPQIDGAAAEIDLRLGGALRESLRAGEFAGKPGEHVVLHAWNEPFRRVLALGVGPHAKLKAHALATYAGAAVRSLAPRGVKTVGIALPPHVDARAAASAIAEGAIAATFESTTYQTKLEAPGKVERALIVAPGHDLETVRAGVARGTILGESLTLTRTLALTPGNDMTPRILAERARATATETGLEIDVLDEARMRELGMGSLLSVSRGSAEEATLTVLTYTGDPESDERLALIGKGITFDTGGISIKPAADMHEMKYDMSGGAAVIGAMAAIARLKPRINVIGLVPAAENMPGSRATKPGDIVRAMNGKTIEVLNTDAEGRLVLADALCYATKLGATRVVDCATLTGACVVALGHAASAALGRDDAFMARFLAVSEATGERYWRMPLYDEYATAMKSEIADLANVGGRAAGTCTAGAFLAAFVPEDTPWIHLDIAGTAYGKGNAALAKGPTGTPLRALVAFAEALAGDAPRTAAAGMYAGT